MSSQTRPPPSNTHTTQQQQHSKSPQPTYYNCATQWSFSNCPFGTTEIVLLVLVTVLAFVTVTFILYCLIKLRKKEMSEMEEEAAQQNRAINNIYSKLPVRQKRFQKFRKAPDRSLPPIPQDAQNQVVYAQIEILNPLGTSNHTHPPEPARTFYAEIQVPSTARNEPTVQCGRRLEDTYGYIMRNMFLPPYQHDRSNNNSRPS